MFALIIEFAIPKTRHRAVNEGSTLSTTGTGKYVVGVVVDFPPSCVLQQKPDHKSGHIKKMRLRGLYNLIHIRVGACNFTRTLVLFDTVVSFLMPGYRGRSNQ